MQARMKTNNPANRICLARALETLAISLRAYLRSR
jgi:hypothetical protein